MTTLQERIKQPLDTQNQVLTHRYCRIRYNCSNIFTAYDTIILSLNIAIITLAATERIRVSPEVKAALNAAQLPDESYSETIERLIDEAVYDLFKLTDAEREVVEEYLDVF